MQEKKTGGVEKLKNRDENSFPTKSNRGARFNIFSDAPNTMALFSGKILQKEFNLNPNYVQVLLAEQRSKETGWLNEGRTGRGIGWNEPMHVEGQSFSIYFSGTFTEAEKVKARNMVREALKKDGLLKEM